MHGPDRQPQCTGYIAGTAVRGYDSLPPAGTSTAARGGMRVAIATRYKRGYIRKWTTEDGGQRENLACAAVGVSGFLGGTGVSASRDQKAVSLLVR